MKYFPQNLDYYILIPQFISQISEESLARVRAGLHDPPPVDEEDEGGGCGGGGWPLHGQGGLRGVVTLRWILMEPVRPRVHRLIKKVNKMSRVDLDDKTGLTSPLFRLNSFL